MGVQESPSCGESVTQTQDSRVSHRGQHYLALRDLSFDPFARITIIRKPLQFQRNMAIVPAFVDCDD
jgi:hypothetical protein